MKRYLVLIALVGFSIWGNAVFAHERGDWCSRHPRACEERRGYHDHDRHRIEKWCRRHPRACQEYNNPPRPIVLVPPAPVVVVPPQQPQYDGRDAWCRRHPHKCEDHRHHRH